MPGFQKADEERYRDRVAGPDGQRLMDVLADFRKSGFRIDAPQRVRVPKPYGSAHPRAELFKRRSLIVWFEDHSPERYVGEQGLENVLTICQRLSPLNDWLA